MGFFTGILAFILSVNGFVVIVISLILGFISHFGFGFAVFILSILVIISSPEFNLRVGENQWRFGIPVFPGTGLLRFALVLTIISSILFAIFGGDWIQTQFTKGINFNSQKNVEDRTYLIQNSYVYFELNGKLVSKKRIRGEEVLLLETNISLGNGEKFARVMFQNDDGIYFDGREAFVPISALSRKVSRQTSAVQKSSQSKPKKQSGVVVLTPEEIWARNEHRAYPGQMLITLPEYKAYNRVVLLEDFVIETDNPQNVTVVAFSGKRGFIGEGKTVRVPAGTEFRFGGGEPMISVVSRGEQKFSSLKLKEVK